MASARASSAATFDAGDLCRARKIRQARLGVGAQDSNPLRGIYEAITGGESQQDETMDTDRGVSRRLLRSMSHDVGQADPSKKESRQQAGFDEGLTWSESVDILPVLKDGLDVRSGQQQKPFPLRSSLNAQGVSSATQPVP